MGKHAKGHILYVSTYITFSKRQKYKDGGYISGCQWLRIVGRGVGVTIKEGQERDLCGDEIVLYLDRVVVTQVYISD